MTPKEQSPKKASVFKRLIGPLPSDELETVYRPRDYRALLKFVKQAEAEWPEMPIEPRPTSSSSGGTATDDAPAKATDGGAAETSPRPSGRRASRQPTAASPADGATQPSSSVDHLDAQARRTRHTIRFGRL